MRAVKIVYSAQKPRQHKLTGDKQQTMALDRLGRACKSRVAMATLVERIACLLDDAQFLVHKLLQFLTTNAQHPHNITIYRSRTHRMEVLNDKMMVKRVKTWTKIK